MDDDQEPDSSQLNVQLIEDDAANAEGDSDSISFNFKSFDGFLDKAIEELQTSERSSVSVDGDVQSVTLESDSKDGSNQSFPSLDNIPEMGVLDDCKYNISTTASLAGTSVITDFDFNLPAKIYGTTQMDSNRESGVESDSDNMAELAALLNTEIPEGRNSLVDSHTNLERVAEYCEGNYFQAENKRIALEETKNYTTQSLASVAYQINTLAYNFLQLLDLQASQLSEMEGQMNHIAQMVMIHKEKVARREIGVLTANKTTARQYKIIAPASPEKPIKYVRKPIDFNALDDIGHGVRSNMPRNKQRGSGSQGSIHPPNASPLGVGVGPAPTTKPPTPPSVIRATGSLSKSSREYRTPPAVAPPQVPSHYAPNYPIGHPRRERGPGYSTLPHPSAHHSPQVGMVHPQPQQNNTSVLQINSNAQNIQNMPRNHSGSGMEIMDGRQYLHTLPRHPSNNSPPLPPPPEEEHARFGQPRGSAGVMPIIPDEHDLPGWVPKNYIEKVVAIYDYFADKEDELSFQESAVIYVLKKNDDGWWEGVMDGTTGLFPGNYVEPCV